MEAARADRRLKLVEKQAYYRGPGMPAALAARYFREFGDALAPGDRTVLDLGCGAGDFGRHAPPGVEVHGVDNDLTAVELASRHERAVAVDLDSAPLPYPDASFDAVLAKDIFEHLDDPLALALEAYRVTRPGGVIVASVVMAKPHRVWADYTHRRGFTRDAARMLLEDAGFRVEKSWRMGGVPLSNRLNFIDHVPALLEIPVFDALWGSSWELKARR